MLEPPDRIDVVEGGDLALNNGELDKNTDVGEMPNSTNLENAGTEEISQPPTNTGVDPDVEGGDVPDSNVLVEDVEPVCTRSSRRERRPVIRLSYDEPGEPTDCPVTIIHNAFIKTAVCEKRECRSVSPRPVGHRDSVIPPQIALRVPLATREPLSSPPSLPVGGSSAPAQHRAPVLHRCPSGGSGGPPRVQLFYCWTGSDICLKSGVTDGSLLQTQTTGEMIIRTVSKSDEGLYHCKHPERGESPQSWLSVRGDSAAQPGDVTHAQIVTTEMFLERNVSDEAMPRPNDVT
ncbi:hypothetical protein SRHO_G00332970 [Serrasalmus rhombeus]